MTEDEKNLSIIAEGLADFFRDEPKKIAIWLLTVNPNFGGIAPAVLITIRGSAGLRKVASFISSARGEEDRL